MTYGTGAIMAVPAHDDRDFAFALKFGLPIIPVIERTDRIAKSAIWDGSVTAEFGGALKRAGIAWDWLEIAGRGRFYAVTLDGDAQVATYARLLQDHLKPGHWGDIVGRGWQVVFEDGPLALTSVEADAAIMARCQAGYDYMRQFRTTMEMWWAVEWYRDVLYHHEYGAMINSGAFTGTPGDVAKKQVTEWLAEQGKGQAAVNYRLHDWLISRQRYWGAPIPMIYCETCGIVPVPYEDLPVVLPIDAEIPSTGENALKFHEGFLHVKCPKCGGDARRETDTMDTFMCSSWYNYAYVTPYWKAGQPLSPDDTPWDPAEGAYWLPVDQYTGGPEHATMHLLYTRFFTKALRDMGVVPFRRADAAAVQPGHHPGARRPAHEQEQGQRGRARRMGGEIRRRHRARVPDVHRPVGCGRPVEFPGHRGREALPGARVERGRRIRGQGAGGRSQRCGSRGAGA